MYSRRYKVWWRNINWRHAATASSATAAKIKMCHSFIFIWYRNDMRKFIAARKRQLITLIVVIIVIAGIIGGLWVTNVFGWRQWRVQEAQGFIGAPLPTGATAIQFTTRNTSTRIIWLRFSLPAN